MNELSTKSAGLIPRFDPGPSEARWKSIVAMVVCALGVFLLLPFTQLISGGGKPATDIRTVDVTLPPPPPPPPEPPPPEEKPDEEPPPEMQRPPQQLSLSQMELALNPGIGDAMAGAFGFDGFNVNPDTVGDLTIFDIADLDRPPGRIRSVPPVYPIELRRARVEGEVKLILIIDQTGRPTVESVAEFTARAFVQPAVEAVQQCLFEPPTKDGQPVRARYSMRVPFRMQ